MDSVTPKPVTPHPEKKMKQARLPFQVIRTSPKESVQPCKKSKLDNQVVTSIIPVSLEVKENIAVASKVPSSSEELTEATNVDIAEVVQMTLSHLSNEEIANQTDKSFGNTNNQISTIIISDSENSSSPQKFMKGELRVSKDNSKSSNSLVSENKRKVLSDDETTHTIDKRIKLEVVEKLLTFAKINNESTGKCDVFLSRSSMNDNGIDDIEMMQSGKADVTDMKLTDKCMDIKTKAIQEINDSGSCNTVDRKSSPVKSIGSPITVEEHQTESHAEIPIVKENTQPKEQCVTPESRKSKTELSAKKKTPKQLQKAAESAKKRELLQQEREKKRLEEQQEKRRKKEEKEEIKRKQKEEKEKKKQAEIDQKNEEKRKKEEERRKKEEQKLEEKRKKEEEAQRKKEEENQMKVKFRKEAEAFSNFFKKVDPKATSTQDEHRSIDKIVFMPFTVKSDMRLAPINRNPFDSNRRSNFEELFSKQPELDTYLTQLHSKEVIPKQSGNTWPLEEKYDDLVVLEDLDLNGTSELTPQPKRKHPKPKLLQFHENRRPPYWGTWRKKSKFVKPRNPLGQDKLFDYEFDSDDEWEEEDPGESLHGSDDEKEPEDDYEVDNDFFVPHGYLSDDENPEEEILSPETQKAKLKLLGEQFDQERNEKTKQLRPIAIGCVWFDCVTDEPESAKANVVKLLNCRKAIIWTETLPISTHGKEDTDPSDAGQSEPTTPVSNKKMEFPESAMADLIRFFHGNTKSRKTLANNFVFYWNKSLEQQPENETNASPLNRACVARKVKELAVWQECPEEGPMHSKMCWFVKKELRDKYDLLDLPVPNTWEETVSGDKQQKITPDGVLDSAKKGSPSLITKFTKVLTEDERKSQLKLKRNSRNSASLFQNASTPGKNSSKKLLQFWAKASCSANKQSTDTPAPNAEEMDVDVIPLDGPDSGTPKQSSSIQSAMSVSPGQPRSLSVRPIEFLSDVHEVRSGVSKDLSCQNTTKTKSENDIGGVKNTIERQFEYGSVKQPSENIETTHQPILISEKEKITSDVPVKNEEVVVAGAGVYSLQPKAFQSTNEQMVVDDRIRAGTEIEVSSKNNPSLTLENVESATPVTEKENVIEMKETMEIVAESVKAESVDLIAVKSHTRIISENQIKQACPAELETLSEIVSHSETLKKEQPKSTSDKKPIVKKRVAILMSVPRGQEIKSSEDK